LAESDKEETQMDKKINDCWKLLGLLGVLIEARPGESSQIVAIKFFLKELGSNLDVRLNVEATFEWSVL